MPSLPTGVFGTVDVGAGSLPDDLITVGKAGRFRAVGMVPDLKYRFEPRDGRKSLGVAVRDVVLESGEAKTPGDLAA